ncbi:MAG: copper-binding protein [Gammaproteobacteria bacterium]|nr:copper-binding protein [Gammaproteobacteria bacterium]
MKTLLLTLIFLAAPAFAADHGHMHGHDAQAAQAPAVASVKAVLNGVDAAAHTVKVAHEPIAAFNWPAMTMDLPLAEPDLAKGIAPGTHVILRIEKRSPVDYVVVGISREHAH